MSDQQCKNLADTQPGYIKPEGGIQDSSMPAFEKHYSVQEVCEL